VEKDVQLPPEWKCLEGKVSFVCKHSNVEYSSSCPKCGGAVHADGSYPDRCRLFVDGHPTMWCRRCKTVSYPDQFGDDRYGRPSPQEIEAWRQKRIVEEEGRRQKAEQSLAFLRSSRIWERYHRALVAGGRDYWRTRGIPDSLQNWWKLGWQDEYVLHRNDEDYMGQSATIPLFDNAWQVMNIKHRLLYFPDNIGKYRYEIHGQGQPLFLANPDVKISGQVYAIEGEIKAMVTWMTLDDKNACVVGMPGCTPNQDIIAQIGGAERVTLVLDPGAEESAVKIAKEIGVKKCRVLIPPVKIDDGILAIRPSKRELAAYLKTAVPIGGGA
jgi:hypothetical protein